VSEILQSSKHATISQIYPFATLLLDFYENPVDDEVMDVARKAILYDLRERWCPISESILIPCFLDPRFKCLSFVEEQLKRKVVDQVRSLYMQERANENEKLQTDQDGAPSENEDTRDLYSLFADHSVKRADVTNH
jgi:hypothetical protein